MAFYINNNITAMRSSVAMNSSYGNLADSISRLASGLKVQSASDDAQAYTSSVSMQAGVSTLNQGMRNANDAISLVQTADGALQVIDTNLIRMKELAEQAATGHYDSVQRGIIDSEYQILASEITRIANMTEFNNIKLLNGNLDSDEYHGGFFEDFPGKLKIHYGPSNNENKDFTYLQIDNSTASALGVGNNSTPGGAGYTLSTQDAAQRALGAIDAAISQTSTTRATLGAVNNSMEATIHKLGFEAENLTASSSRLVDVDIAKEMTTFTKYQILTQTTGSIITQANAAPRMALELLGN